MDISLKLKAWRGANAQGRGVFTQVEAAEFLGVPYRTYQDWELGRSSPRGLALSSLFDLIKSKPKRRDVRHIKLGKDN